MVTFKSFLVEADPFLHSLHSNPKSLKHSGSRDKIKKVEDYEIGIKQDCEERDLSIIMGFYRLNGVVDQLSGEGYNKGERREQRLRAIAAFSQAIDHVINDGKHLLTLPKKEAEARAKEHLAKFVASHENFGPQLKPEEIGEILGAICTWLEIFRKFNVPKKLPKWEWTYLSRVVKVHNKYLIHIFGFAPRTDDNDLKANPNEI